MIRPTEIEQSERDERLGEAIETYLGLAEGGHAPDPETFANDYPDLSEELREALQGLALVQGLVGASGDGSRRLEAGRRVAGYRIVRELGRGGMGVVYEAVHVDLDRPVALKVLGAHAAPDSSSRRRFLNEAKTAAALHHTHIVPVFDVGQVGGLCYYAMQRIEGSGLDCVLKSLRRGRTTAAGSTSGKPSSAASGSGTTSLIPAPLTAALTNSGLAETGSWGTSRGSLTTREPHHVDEPPPFEPPRGPSYYRWVARVGRQAAEALAHAHRRGVIHRDIKPSNLLVDARGTIWVADFGLARRLTDPSMTQTESALGTPRYMSPEQAGAQPIDGRTDIYSLGATLYELLALRPPFDGRTSAELARQISEREAVSPRRFDPRLPRDLETIVLKAMAKRSPDRYETAAALADDLERFLKHEPVRARRIGPLGRAWRFARRHPSLTAVSAVATVVVLSTAAVAYVRVVQERDRALSAEVKAQGAKVQAEMANLKTQAAMRQLLLSQAALVRASTVPNRRERGLSLVAQAARSGPDAALRAQLRDEAVQFLALRDIEARGEFALGKTWGIAFGAEGKRLAAVSADGLEFHLWDVEEHEPVPAHPLRSSTAGPETESPVPHFPLGGSRLGAGIASAGPVLAVVRPDGPGVRLFDATTGNHLRDVLETVEHPIVSLYATTDGRRLITVERIDNPERGPDGSQVHLWESREQGAQPLATLGGSRPENLGRSPSFPLVSVGPDNTMIATAWMGAKEVTLWSTEDGRPLGTIATPVAATALALGPEGQLAVAGGGTISLWQAGTGQPLPGLSQHQGFVRAMRFSPDRGSLLAVAGLGSGVEVWDVGSGTLAAALKTPDVVQDLDFAPGGPSGDRLLVAASGASASAWAVVEPAVRNRASGFERGPSALAFGPGSLLALVSRTSANASEVRLWNTDHCPTTTQTRDESRSSTVEFDGQGRLGIIDAESIRWFQPPGLEPVAQVELPRIQRPEFWTGPRGFIQSVARSADGRTLVLARASELFLWRAADPDQVRPLRLPEQPRTRSGRPSIWRDLALAPAGDRLYLVGSDRHVHAWAIAGDRARDLDWTGLDIEVGRSPEGRALVLSPDGTTLALADRPGNVVLIDTSRGTIRRRLPRSDGDDPAGTLAFSPRGDELAVGTRQGVVHLWSLDADSRAIPLVRLPGHRGAVTTLAYSVRGDRLAAGGEDKTVDVWSLDRVRRQLQTLGLGW